MIKLRDYQEEISDKACSLLKEKGLAYLSMQVRTGKTLTAFASAQKFGAKRVLLISKLKALSSIKKDYELLDPSYDLDCINYESAHKMKSSYDLIIIDEAHSLGAFPKPSKRTENIKSLVGSTPVLFLSGTPTPESYSQIFHQLWISDHSPFREFGDGTRAFYKFAKEYVNVVPRRVNGFIVNDYSDAKKDEVLSVINPYMLTYTQEEAGFSQVIHEHILDCRSSESTEYIFDTLKKDRCYNRLYDGVKILADTPANLMNKLNQICGGTVIDTDGNHVMLDTFKAERIKEYFAGKKIAIFYLYKSERDMLINFFSDSVTENPEEFQHGDYKVFIGQIRSVREGVRLDKADALVFYTMEFSYLSYEQGRNRLMSKERTKPAEVYFCVSQMGFERKILEAVNNKKDFTYSWYFKHGRAGK